MPERARLDVMDQVVSCEGCELHDRCSGPVFLSGPTPARIAVVGEAPGRQEDEQGAPFVGPAGKLLRKALASVGVDPDAVAFVNTVSCFPDGTPTWDHVHACATNKTDQLDLVDPQFVLPVGKVAMKGFKPWLDLRHGRARPWFENGRIHFATYHPAAALRNGNYEEAMVDDLRTFAELLERPDEWQSFQPASCSGCANTEVVWYEECGLGWCEVHLPSHEAERYQARMAVVQADYETAKGVLS